MPPVLLGLEVVQLHVALAVLRIAITSSNFGSRGAPRVDARVRHGLQAVHPHVLDTVPCALTHPGDSYGLLGTRWFDAPPVHVVRLEAMPTHVPLAVALLPRCVVVRPPGAALRLLAPPACTAGVLQQHRQVRVVVLTRQYVSDAAGVYHSDCPAMLAP
jgi:hypothetical protein